MGIQLKLSAALFYTAAALAMQVIYIPTTAAAAAAHPGPDPGYPAASELADRLLQMFYNAEQEQEMVQEQLEEKETAENNFINIFKDKKWWGTDYGPITTPRGYNVFALQVSSADRDGMNNA
jgi:hypothetical protein